ncbi:MAG: hypothetical protein AB7O66_01825 [Limisphaerales bacterium]
MKTSKLAGWGTLLIAGIGLAWVAWQERRLSELEAEQARVQSEIARPPQELASTAPVQEVRPLSPEERLELMSLRRRATELSGIQRRMARVVDENAALREQAVAISNRVANPFPPGWVKRSEARLLGFSTPEAALESFIWALHHRDTNVLFQALLPGMADGMVRNAEANPDAIWDSAPKLPGFLIRSKTTDEDGAVRLDVEIAPGALAPEMKWTLVNGGWRLSP